MRPFSILPLSLSASLRQVIALSLVGVIMLISVPLTSAHSSGHKAAITSDSASRSGAGERSSKQLFPFQQDQGSSNRGMPSAPSNGPGVTPQRPPSKAEREGEVAQLKVTPKDGATLEVGQHLVLSAIPLDADGNVVHGVVAEWESTDEKVATITKDGEAMAISTGTADLVASVGEKKETVSLSVVPAKANNSEDQSSRADSAGKRLKEFVQMSARSNGRTKRDDKEETLRAHAAKRADLVFEPAPLPSSSPLPSGEDQSIYSPANNIGAPPGKTTLGAPVPAAATNGTEMPGSSNFTFSLPVTSLPGRGMDASLSLVYNSNLWNKSGTSSYTHMTYDVDNGWPAPGFTIGYGRMELQKSPTILVTDPSGTRHQLTLTSNGVNGSLYDSTDGTFIHLVSVNNTFIATFPGGTQIEYGAHLPFSDIYYPIKITDRNGNFINITYAGANGAGPRIASVIDTVGRSINFHYDDNTANHELVAITAPSLTGHADRQVMRFYYQTITFNTSALFSNVNTVDVPSSARVIQYIYLRDGVESGDAHIGYRFDYSIYGMIYQVAQIRGMSVNGDSLSAAGTVNTSSGTQAALTTYNYQGTFVNSATGLSDAPYYTTRTDDWAGRVSAQPVYTFSVNKTTGVSIVTSPDGTRSETHAIVNAGQWNDGLINETIVRKPSPDDTVLSDTVISWEPNPVNNTPRIQKVQATNQGTNQAEQTKTVEYFYDDTHTAYNNVSEVKEYDFGTTSTYGALLRRTVTSYVTTPDYTSRGLISLPARVDIYGEGTNTPSVSTTTYGYDQETLTSYSDVNYPSMMYTDPGTTAKRGNLTAVTQYIDSATGITHSTSYDVFGNVITASVDCCQMKSFAYSDTYHHAYPTLLTRGTNPTFTSSTTYDLQTGLVGSTTDENGRITNIYYNTDSLRPEHLSYPDGGATYFHYSDGFLADAAGRLHYFTNTVTRLKANNGGDDALNLSDSYRFYDGRGAVTQTFDNFASSNWSTVDIEYDVMGRAYRTSNPYYCGGYGWAQINPSSLWTTSTFDNLGRVTQVDMPTGDSSSQHTTIRAAYDGSRVLTTDQAGKQRLSKTNALGQMKDVWEIKAADSVTESVSFPSYAEVTAGYHTAYTYDALNDLLKVEQITAGQSGQTRSFKYDGLGRLTFERQVEEAAHYDDSGEWTTNGTWSRHYVYNSYSFLTAVHDANGIVTTIEPDGLNRVHQISYSDGKTPTVTYTYDESRTGYYNQDRLTSLTTAATASAPQTVQEYDYDQMGRVSSQRQKIGSTTYTMGYTYNLAGELLSESYLFLPNHVVNYLYNEAGQLSQVTDQNNVPYDNGFTYAPHGGLTAETFGNGAMRNLSYNNSLQPKQVKLTLSGAEQQRYDYLYGTLNPADGSVDVTKNNGQVGRLDGFINGVKQWDQRFSYDQLGRLSTVGEYQSGLTSSRTYEANYDYDRWGNRFQKSTKTQPTGYAPVEATDISTATNRFTSGVSYDYAGNITSDAKFRQMDYTYDANNRQLTATTTGTTFTQTSVYDGAGQRVQTTSPTGTVRQMVYDIFGQDIADLSDGSLERENIYRGGELLATMEIPAHNTTMTTTESVSWTNQVNTSSTGNSLTKINVTGWNGGANSAQKITSGDGYVEFTVSEMSDRLGGLVHNNTGAGYTDLDFAFYAQGAGNLSIYESGSNKASVGTYSIGDRLRVAIDGGVVKYSKNGTVLYTSTVAPTYPLQMDTSLYQTGATVSDAVISGSLTGSSTENISWTNTVSTSASGNTLTKTGATGWGGGGNSTRQIASGDGFVEFTTDNNTTDRLFGLVHNDTTPSYTDLDFAFYAQSGGSLSVYESGVNKASVGTYAAGDHLKVSIEGGSVKYRKNGTVLYTSSVAPTYPLKADASLYQVGATISNAVISGSALTGGTLNYVMSDAQGSARVVMNGNQIVARHDFMPFGEEVGAGTGLRSTTQSYNATDRNRQKYALTERDDSTGLDHTPFRKYESRSGRWTSPDPYTGSMSLSNPQSFNRYAYVQNDPVNFVDPSGLNMQSPWHYSEADLPGNSMGFWSPGIHVISTLQVSSRTYGAANDSLTTYDPHYFYYAIGGTFFGGGSTGVDPQNPTALDEAARIVEIALSANQACRDLFSANVNPVQLLRDLRSNKAGVGSITYSDLGGVRADGTVRNASTTGNRSGVTISINSNPAALFQAGYTRATGDSAFRASLSKEINNAITLLHELGHAAVGLYGDNASRIARDRGNETASAANSRLVFETCFVY